MARNVGNHQLKAARVASGFPSQDDLAAALTAAAAELGLRGVSIGPRQVRRWESSSPPWPQPHHQRLLSHVLGLPMESLGFSPPWQPSGANHGASTGDAPARRRQPARSGRRGQARATPAAVAADLAAVTVAHRHLYWTVEPADLHPVVVEHVRLGEPLLRRADGAVRVTLGRSLAESALLAGRIEFFDLRDADAAGASWVRAMQFASDADDQLLGAAVLGHAAFVPGWAGRREEMTERVSAARAYARRGGAPALFHAWLDAAEAECLTRCSETTAALAVLSAAASRIGEAAEPLPAWMDWFTPTRLLAFTGNTELAAGRIRRARDTLTRALDGLPPHDVKQRSVILADLAAVEVAAEDVAAACARAAEALDALADLWYATGMDRIRQVRRSLRPWQNDDCVRRLDERLYGWDASLSAMSR